MLPSVIATNLEYCIAPGFCIMGIYFIFDKLYNMFNRNRQVKNGVTPALILLFSMSFMYAVINYAVAVLTILGLYTALIGDIKKFYEKAKKAVFDDYDDDDNDDDDSEDGRF
jgi:predicted membrane protein